MENLNEVINEFAHKHPELMKPIDAVGPSEETEETEVEETEETEVEQISELESSYLELLEKLSVLAERTDSESRLDMGLLCKKFGDAHGLFFLGFDKKNGPMYSQVK